MNNETTDYILVKNGIPVEAPDVVYAAESVIELFNNGFNLNSGESFVPYNPTNN